MTTETYSLATNFSGGLNNLQLMDEINADASITTTYNCTNVRTDGDPVYIDFDGALSGAEQTALDSLIGAYVYVAPESIGIQDRYALLDPLLVRRRVNNTALAFSAGTPLTIQNWSSVDGSLSGWDNTTGIFTVPENGFYSFNLLVGLNSTNNTSASIRSFNNDTSATLYAKTLTVSTLASDYTGGALSLDWLCYYDAGLNIRFEAEFTNAQSADLELSIVQLYKESA